MTTKYTKESIISYLKENNISSVSELRNRNRAMYTWYCRHKDVIGEIPLSKIKRGNNELSVEECFKIAKKFQHRSDLQKNDKGAYIKLLRAKKLNEACAHMTAKPVNYHTKHVINNIKGKPAANRVDMTGQTVNNWTVLNLVKTKDKSINWLCRCKCGTESVVPGGNLRLGLSKKCINCSTQVSEPTKEIYEFLKSKDIEVILSYKNFGFEVDLYIPKSNLIIEYDGLIWHSNKFRVTEATEKARYKKLLGTGCTIFRIFEDEYKLRKDTVLNMIIHRIKGPQNAPVNNYELRIISNPSKYRQFFEDNHLDGYGRASFGVGAFYENKLISCMTFRPYMSGKYKGQMELARFCSDKTVNAYKVFGKLLKFAKKHIKETTSATHIVSASDNRLSQGKTYANNGFKFEQGSDDQLNYYYYLHSKGLRLHRATCRKLHPPKITEEQYAQYNTEQLQTSSGLMAFKKFNKWEPLYKIWGWGNKLWVLTL